MLQRCITSALILALVCSFSTLEARDKEREVVVQDAHYGEVLFHFYKGDYFPAIVRLLAAQQESQLTNHEDDSELLLGGMFLSYGHHLEAAEIFEKLLADNVDLDVRDRTWFFLAKIWQQRGYIAESQEALENIEGELPKNLQREAQMLQAQLFIDAGEYDAAIALLDRWKGRTEWASYARFNLGVALVRSGRTEDAERVLSKLGQMNPFNEELASLRDKANLAMGYAMLQADQPTSAKSTLQRVRLEGPFSNKALLGVGWADAEQENYERALVPWMELRGRDLLDPAVQESMLSIPYAMAKLDAVSQAADHYVNAIEAFYEETNRIDQTISQLESGVFFDKFITDDPLDSTGWYWQLQELPDGAEAKYLYHLLATHQFQEGLKNYRDLNYLYRNLDSWEDSVNVYANMLETRRLAYEERLPTTEAALARADIDGLVSRKLEFDSRLNLIESSNDWLALASRSEYEMWTEIIGYEQSPALQSGLAEAAEVNDKISLLKGVLQWDLEKDFKNRLWRIRRDLKDTGEAMVETQRSRRQIDETMRQQPIEFESFASRVYGLEPRIRGMKLRVANAMAEQRDFLQSIAVGELSAQKDRLDVYTVQARFALAAIYDRAATVGENR